MQVGIGLELDADGNITLDLSRILARFGLEDHPEARELLTQAAFEWLQKEFPGSTLYVR